MLVYDAVKLRDSNAVGGTEFFYGLLQIVGRNTAHFHSTGTSNGVCSQIKVKQLCSGFCILAVHFKEISDLEKHNVIGVFVLDVIVSIHQLAELSLTGLHFLILGFLFGGEISAVSDKVFKACENLVPVQLHIGTIGLLQADALAGAVNPSTTGYRVRAAADTVLVL